VHLGGRLTSLALGFFLLVTIAAYTANLAADLIVSRKSGLAVDSWDAILRDPSKKVCTKASTADFLAGSPWNLPAAQAVRFDSRSAVFQDVGTSVCAAAVASLEDFVKAQESGNFCNLARVGDPLYLKQRAAPVSERAFRLLRYHLKKTHESGKWKEVLSKWEVKPKCAKADAEESGIDIQGMSGPLLLSSFLGACGIIATLARPKIMKIVSMSGIDVLSSDEPVPSSGEPAQNSDISREELHQFIELQKKLSTSLEGALKRPNSIWKKALEEEPWEKMQPVVTKFTTTSV